MRFERMRFERTKRGLRKRERRKRVVKGQEEARAERDWGDLLVEEGAC